MRTGDGEGGGARRVSCSCMVSVCRTLGTKSCSAVGALRMRPDRVGGRAIGRGRRDPDATGSSASRGVSKAPSPGGSSTGTEPAACSTASSRSRSSARRYAKLNQCSSLRECKRRRTHLCKPFSQLRSRAGRIPARSTRNLSLQLRRESVVMLLLILSKPFDVGLTGRLDAIFALRALPLVQQDVSEPLAAIVAPREHQGYLNVDSTLRIWHTKTCSLGENE